jgi:DNA (cytosine-5)-methyltransferase 1
VNFVSLFSGVGGFDLGLEAAGWQCVAQVEWDKNCQQVLARHWPDVPRWGDVSTVSGAELPAADVVAFGSPCQDLSVAGKRAGLDGHRSGLFFEAIRIIKEMQDATAGTSPRFVIWENVAGALSSSGGWDFAAVIDSLGELGAVDIAWRILDARFFGVPQRRRRVFVVADLAGECAGAIHAEPEGVRWHPPTRNQEGTQPAAGVADGLGVDGHDLTVFGQSQFAGYTPGVNTLAATTFKRANDNIVVNALTQGLGSGGPDLAHAEAGWIVAQPQVFTKAKRASSVDDDETWVDGQTAPTLKSFDNTGDSRATVVIQYDGYNQRADDSGISRTLRIGQDSGDCILAFHQTQDPISGPVSPALGTTSHGMGIATSTVIRRLTPLECERLMGWPDDHTRWRADGTEQADSVRYRQCGNGVASPVATWIADMINQALEAE